MMQIEHVGVKDSIEIILCTNIRRERTAYWREDLPTIREIIADFEVVESAAVTVTVTVTVNGLTVRDQELDLRPTDIYPEDKKFFICYFKQNWVA